jgi:hypothetical protein
LLFLLGILLIKIFRFAEYITSRYVSPVKTIPTLALAKPEQRITNIEPWPRQVIEKAYRRVGNEWDKIEAAATCAQGIPDFND